MSPINNKPTELKNISNIKNIPDNSFFCKESVKRSKNKEFKLLCETAIRSCGLSNQDFYEKAQITRQQWYYWSWGIDKFPSWLKIRLCDIFGKPFRDLFLMEGKE